MRNLKSKLALIASMALISLVDFSPAKASGGEGEGGTCVNLGSPIGRCIVEMGGHRCSRTASQGDACSGVHG